MLFVAGCLCWTGRVVKGGTRKSSLEVREAVMEEVIWVRSMGHPAVTRYTQTLYRPLDTLPTPTAGTLLPPCDLVLSTFWQQRCALVLSVGRK